MSETRNVFVRISERDKESSPIISLEFIVHHHTHTQCSGQSTLTSFSFALMTLQNACVCHNRGWSLHRMFKLELLLERRVCVSED